LTPTSGAAGPDGLAVLFLKVFSHELQPILLKFFRRALLQWLTAEIKRGRTTLLPKTSPASRDPAHYRPITVLPVLLRVYHKVVDLHLRAYVYTEGILGPFQAGFMPGRSTYDQAFVLSTLAAACPHQDSALVVVLLDIAKAYDSIVHKDLLQVMQELRVPREWCEVVRLLLLDNSTAILGQEVAVTRGCPQGSPLSPLLCLFMVEHLHRHLKESFPVGPGSFPLDAALAEAGLPDDLWALLLHLAYCDDNALLRTTVPPVQALLDATGSWLDQHHLRASPKSTALVLSAPRGAFPRPTVDLGSAQAGEGAPADLQPTLVIQGMDIRWVGVETYLGLRFAAQRPSPSARFDQVALPESDKPALSYHLHALRQTFTARGAAPLLHLRLAAFGVKQGILAKFQYPAVVLQPSHKMLDNAIFPALRRNLRLVPNYHSALLWHELNLWPTEFYTDTRVLRYVFNLKQEHWFYTRIYLPLYVAGQDSILTQPGGALARLLGILAKYDMDLASADTGDDKEAWSLTVTARVRAGMTEHFFEKYCTYPARHRAHLQKVLDLQPDGRPKTAGLYPLYLKLGGVWAGIGLLAKGYALRLLTGERSDTDRPSCYLCRLPHAECGAHLIICPRLSRSLAAEREALLFAIHHEVHGTTPAAGSAPQLPNTLLRTWAIMHLHRLAWPNATPRTMKNVLWLYSSVINYYRDHLELDPDGCTPVFPVPVSPHRALQ